MPHTVKLDVMQALTESKLCFAKRGRHGGSLSFFLIGVKIATFVNLEGKKCV